MLSRPGCLQSTRSGLRFDALIVAVLILARRVTDAWHYWAPHVAQFNARILSRDVRDVPPAGYERLWAVGIDACVVCSVEILLCAINHLLLVFTYETGSYRQTQ